MCPEEENFLPRLSLRHDLRLPHRHREASGRKDWKGCHGSSIPLPASRMEFDACGHYSRPDVLEPIVH